MIGEDELATPEQVAELADQAVAIEKVATGVAAAPPTLADEEIANEEQADGGEYDSNEEVVNGQGGAEEKEGLDDEEETDDDDDVDDGDVDFEFEEAEEDVVAIETGADILGAEEEEVEGDDDGFGDFEQEDVAAVPSFIVGEKEEEDSKEQDDDDGFGDEDDGFGDFEDAANDDDDDEWVQSTTAAAPTAAENPSFSAPPPPPPPQQQQPAFLSSTPTTTTTSAASTNLLNLDQSAFLEAATKVMSAFAPPSSRNNNATPSLVFLKDLDEKYPSLVMTKSDKGILKWRGSAVEARMMHRLNLGPAPPKNQPAFSRVPRAHTMGVSGIMRNSQTQQHQPHEIDDADFNYLATISTAAAGLTALSLQDTTVNSTTMQQQQQQNGDDSFFDPFQSNLLTTTTSTPASAVVAESDHQHNTATTPPPPSYFENPFGSFPDHADTNTNTAAAAAASTSTNEQKEFNADGNYFNPFGDDSGGDLGAVTLGDGVDAAEEYNPFGVTTIADVAAAVGVVGVGAPSMIKNDDGSSGGGGENGDEGAAEVPFHPFFAVTDTEQKGADGNGVGGEMNENGFHAFILGGAPGEATTTTTTAVAVVDEEKAVSVVSAVDKDAAALSIGDDDDPSQGTVHEDGEEKYNFVQSNVTMVEERAATVFPEHHDNDVNSSFATTAPEIEFEWSGADGGDIAVEEAVEMVVVAAEEVVDEEEEEVEEYVVAAVDTQIEEVVVVVVEEEELEDEFDDFCEAEAAPEPVGVPPVVVAVEKLIAEMPDLGFMIPDAGAAVLLNNNSSNGN